MTSDTYFNSVATSKSTPMIQKLLDVIFACRLHVSIFTLVVVWGWGRIFSSSVLVEDYFITPLIISCIYLWNRVWDLQEDQINCPQSTRYFTRFKRPIIILTTLLGISGIALSTIHGPVLAAVILSLVLLIGFAYSAPMLPGFPGKRLKDFYLIKNLTSALGWIVLVTIYPALHANAPLHNGYLLGIAILFLEVMIVEIIWDIRDQIGDQQAGVITLPNVLGPVKTAYWIGALCLISTTMILIGLQLTLLSPVWYLALGNNLLVAYGIRLGTVRLQRHRIWSHSLVVAQTGMFAIAGLLTL